MGMFILAVLFAIPTYGLSLLAYFAWLAYLRHRANQTECPQQDLDLSNIERAILHVAKNFNGSYIGTNFEEISFSYARDSLLPRSIRDWEINDETFEFDVEISEQKFDVHLTKEPNGDGAIFRVRCAEPWLDELYLWWIDECFAYPSWYPKYYFTSVERLVIRGHGGRVTTGMPESIGKLIALRHLCFDDVGIPSIARAIGNLSSLEHLELCFNPIGAVPDDICRLANLKYLDLTGTNITRLPENIGSLSQLESLGLSMTELRTLPASIVQLTKLRYLGLRSIARLELTSDQEKWIAKLTREGADVSLDPGLESSLFDKHPDLIEIRQELLRKETQEEPDGFASR